MSERLITKVDGLPKDIAPAKVASACVIGAGTMGGGITMCFADAGIDVTMVDQSADAVARGMGLIEKNYAASAKKGKLNCEKGSHQRKCAETCGACGARCDADRKGEARCGKRARKGKLKCRTKEKHRGDCAKTCFSALGACID